MTPWLDCSPAALLLSLQVAGVVLALFLVAGMATLAFDRQLVPVAQP